MFSTFRSRLTVTYIVIIAVILSITGVFLSVFFKDYYFSSINSSLLHDARLVTEMIGYYDGQEDASKFFQQICLQAAHDTDTRVTIVDDQGKVLGDSSYKAEEMGIHKDRPEIYQALRNGNGMETRYSETAGVRMLYVAVGFEQGDLKGAARLARPLTEVEAFYHRVLYTLLLAVLLTGLLGAGISIAIAGRFSQPVVRITNAVVDMARGNLKRRIRYRGDDELGKLVSAINNMAEHLDHTIDEISTVKNRLEALLENTVNGIIMIDADNRMAYINPAATVLLGLNENPLGRKVIEVIKSYELLNLIDQVRAQTENRRQSIRIYSPDKKDMEVNVVPINEGDREETISILVVMNDLTETRRLEQVRKDFVANISHELKTPIATISGFAETMLAEGNENAEHIEEFSTIIFEEAQRMKKMINDLLELSRLETGRPELNIRPINMVKLINDSIELIKIRNPVLKARIEFNKPAEMLWIDGDLDSVTNIIGNLLDNALNYSNEGGVITVTLEKQGEEGVKVSVQDQGDGIPEAELPRIFERFYRVDKARSRKTGGTGLGLAIVKHLVENHGGKLEVESYPGQGSTFSFTLPGCREDKKM
jgi:two-component system phosphate regulon sensor histidine kinase PhoR